MKAPPWFEPVIGMRLRERTGKRRFGTLTAIRDTIGIVQLDGYKEGDRKGTAVVELLFLHYNYTRVPVRPVKP